MPNNVIVQPFLACHWHLFQCLPSTVGIFKLGPKFIQWFRKFIVLDKYDVLFLFFSLRVSVHNGPLGLIHLDAETGHPLLEPFSVKSGSTLAGHTSSWQLLPLGCLRWLLLAIAPFKMWDSPCEWPKRWVEWRAFHGRALHVVESERWKEKE